MESLPLSPSARRPGCWAMLLLGVLGIWIISISSLIQGIGWTVDQTFLMQGQPFPLFTWPILSWVQALLIGVPAALAALIRLPRHRAVYQTWVLAAGYSALLAVVRFVPPLWTQAAALAQISLTVVATAVLLGGLRLTRRPLAGGLAGLGFAVAAAAVAALPWVAWGALGSLADTLLNLGAGLSLGGFAAVLLGGGLFGPVRQASLGGGQDSGLGTWAAAITLVILGSGFGFNGSQLLLLIALPPLGATLAAFHRWYGERSLGAWALSIGLVAAVPLMFFDPDEMALVLGGNEILQWAFNAAWVALALGLLIGLVWLGAAQWFRQAPGTAINLLAGCGLAAGAVALYLGAGQPGQFGEQLFVIMKDQADVSAAVTMPDRDTRLRWVYTTLTEHANTSQARLRETLAAWRIHYQAYYLVNALEVNGGALVRLYLAQQPEVDRVIDSPHLRPLPEPIPMTRGTAAAPTTPDWNITSIGADRVWADLGITGAGIVVGQSDTGVDGEHPALASQYRGRTAGNAYNWLDPWNGTESPTDIGGHGTHTLGSILGQGGIGVAPGAQWFACVNLARNLANPPLYLTCLQFMLAPYPAGGNPLTDGDPSQAAHVINNSWGCPPLEGCDARSLQPAVDALRAAGIFVVASAGNEGGWAPGMPICSSVSDPISIYDSAFSVGAVDSAGDLAYFSSRGPVTIDGSGRVKPDLSAPGVDVLSSTPGGTYAVYSGTSMAGPHVVGAVALMWSANPALIGDIDRTETLLRETARPYTGTLDEPLCGGNPENSTGVGLLDIYRAVQAAMVK